ncbi:NmrA domain-containing protein [Mycena venus]|uniref:NmrA domain-containing protein n=1 Tax=Mycena venus TaxID=2733690 RepID=A0A8H6YVK4_9AGAR|nr:NmrA domain-containing protein [Mycena venus]
MSSPRIVSVFGATGLQGGALVDALLKDGAFVPRAISRNPESEASKKLKARGVEVVKGDPLDKAGLVGALRGSEAVFAVTVPVFFLPNMEGKGELVQGKNIVDAAKEVGVKFFVWSSLPSISKISGGKYKNVVQYDEKEAVREYLESSGLTHASLLLPGFLENLYTRPLMKKTDTGFDIAFPIFKPTDHESFAWIARDVPAAVLALLSNYADPAKQINGKSYPVVNSCIPCAKLAEMATKALGVEVTYTTLPPMGLPPMDEMFQAHAEYHGLFSATPIPNPDLVALGMKFSTVEEFMETEVKARFGQ